MKNFFLSLINCFMLLILATGFAIVAHSLGVGKECLSMFFLLSVLFTAIVTGGYIIGFINSVGSFLVVNYLFTEPYYGLRISDRDDIILLVTFLVTALAVGIIASNLRDQRNRAESNEKAAQELISVREEQGKIRFAMESEKLRATLLRSVAHDLRTPLTALSGSSRLLEEEYDRFSDEERRAFISDISEEALWLTNQVENILNITRLREGGTLVRHAEEIVDDIVSEAVNRTSRLMRDHPLSVVLPEEILMVPMDGPLIVQVLINFLNNTVGHTPEGTNVELRVQKKDDTVMFSVTDSGDGIDERIKDSVFERYVTVDTATADGKRGMGLGLAICKEIVEAHGGTISAHNVEPHGACFSFELPLEVDNGTES